MGRQFPVWVGPALSSKVKIHPEQRFRDAFIMPRPVSGLHHPPRDPGFSRLGASHCLRTEVFLGILVAMARGAPLPWDLEPGGTLEKCAVQD